MLPSDYLDAPYPQLAVPDSVNKVLHWADYLSPSHDVLLVLQKVTGYNPFEDIARGFAGDWHGFGVCQAAVVQLQEYFAALAVEVNAVADGLDAGWDGHAADAAVNNVATAANAIAGAQEPLRQIAQDLDRLVLTVSTTAGLIVTLEEKLLDKAIEAAVKAAAAAVTSETVVFGVAFAALALADAVSIVKTVADIAKAWDTLMLVVDGLMTGVLSSIANLHTTVTVPLQLETYRHPGVK